jgi:hypothetical protein
LHAVPESLYVDEATPVCEKMKPSFTLFADTPSVVLLCAPAPAVATAIRATLTTATKETSLRAEAVRRTFNANPPCAPAASACDVENIAFLGG